ncbi:unnamed protein product [Rhizoctonia solani]|uniref:DNA repair protein RAD14 n=1 Tax=Rhizoctonia solani TaxID=456999 RepID=A0A8H3C0E6_9AGAM|nr:unnamed protein product [Rhizoctonia solani]
MPSPLQSPAIATSSNSCPSPQKNIELNRLKAKARLRAQAESEGKIASSSNTNGKRALVVTEGESTSPKKKSQDHKDSNAPLKRDSRLMGRYLDYDLSKMVNSKGGFLVEEKSNYDEETRRKEKERELQRLKQSFDPPVHIEKEKNPLCADCGSVDIDHQFRKVFKVNVCNNCKNEKPKEKNPLCADCGSVDIDHQFRKVFKVNVCNNCKNEKPERYSLLTKTECKQDYLLTDPELRDEEVMPHLLKANPHKSTWNNMMLFVRFQVEEFAFKKWGGPEGLDAEWERRMTEKRAKRSKKFEDGLKDLRRKTRESGWAKRKADEHVHTYGVTDTSLGVQRCTECDFEVEVEEFAM